jgi:hypothetical protein
MPGATFFEISFFTAHGQRLSEKRSTIGFACRRTLFVPQSGSSGVKELFPQGNLSPFPQRWF